jgi:DNA-directed RNA polymerase subunit L
MNPQIELYETDDQSFGFTLSGVNVSLANALRRIILSEIPLVIFRTSPNEQNKCNIITNTCRLNNEILKQRLSCIPIHIKDSKDFPLKDFPLKNYILELNVENTTDTVMIVTSEHFDIKDVGTGKSLLKDKIREIFPPDETTGYFIDFLRLRPRISDEIPGEKIHLTCEFDMGSALEDGMFNAVSTCSYGNSADTAAQDAELVRKIQTWKDEGKNEKEINFETKNWKLLDAKRIFKKDSFDFMIQSIGVYTNNEIVDFGCRILLQKFKELEAIIEKDELEIKNADNTMANCFDVILENEDYTIGKVMEYFLYSKFYETNILTFCGFKKLHPHDNYSIIRVSYKEAVEKSTIKGHLKECIYDAIEVYTKMRKEFARFVRN